MRLNDQVKQTRCPHCNSVFEVTEEEMQQAFGAVRCGDCMKIFNAAYHLINTPHTASEPADPDHTPDEDQYGIPTLHDHPETNSLIDETEDPEETLQPADDTDTTVYSTGLTAIETEETPDREPKSNRDLDHLITDSREQEESTPTTADGHPNQRRNLLVAALLLLPLIGLGGYWLLDSQGSSNLGYVITDIRVAPASSPQKMQVHFQLGNAGNSHLPLPDLNIELLNLSLQPVANEHVPASDISRELTVLAPGSTHALQVKVNRPATFVQTARIHTVSP